LKRSSLILVDAWENPKITEIVKKTIEERYTNDNIRVRSVLLRSSGMVAQAEVHVEVDGNKPLTDVQLLSLRWRWKFVLKFLQFKEHRLFLIPPSCQNHTAEHG
jgi:divalent metal cation (Fe/Co/Zn/Cd) transporter